MALSRRQFVQTAGIGAGAALTSNVWGRGRENSVWSAFERSCRPSKRLICIASNENPVGPGKKVLDSLRALLEGGAKPGRYSNGTGALTEAICAHFKVKPENVLLSEGSTEILRAATQVYTAKTKPLVGTIPTYEECAGYAELIGNPVRGVKLSSEFKIDLDPMLAAAKGAGLVFYCNPNNPTATYVGAKATRDFLTKLHAASPETTVLVDEAYFDYVSDPDHATHVPLAIEDPRVIRRAHLLEGVRHGGPPPGLRDWPPGRDQEDAAVGGLERHRVAQRVRHGRRPPRDLAGRRRRFTTNERNRNKAVRDMVDEVVQRSRHEADRLPGQLHVRQHRHAGEGVP
jgi:histidinol-phosphate aminotransferase